MTAQFRLIMLLQYLETGWIWLYTAGMRGEEAQGRRDELASDAWEHLKYARTRRESAFVQVLGRFVRGMPDDMSWRGGRGLSGFSRSSLGEACVAALIVTGVLGALPLAAVILASEQPSPSFNGNPGAAVVIYLLAILAFFGLPAALVIDRRPVAGLLLALIGGSCVMLTFWHTPFIGVPAFAATSAAVVAAIHMARRSRG